MFNKTINIQKEVRINENRLIAFLNAQITIGYGTINTSVQVIDKIYVEENPDYFKSEYNLFMEEIKKEAIKSGWEALKEIEEVAEDVEVIKEEVITDVGVITEVVEGETEVIEGSEEEVEVPEIIEGEV